MKAAVNIHALSPDLKELVLAGGLTYSGYLFHKSGESKLKADSPDLAWFENGNTE